MRFVAFAAAAVLVSACSDDERVNPLVHGGEGGAGVGAGGSTTTGGAGGGGGEPGPPLDFARFCEGKDWRETFTPATIGESSGEYLGELQVDFERGIQEGTKIIPAHPFAARAIRVGFGEGAGKARLRLMNTFGRSYPASFADPEWPDYNPVVDLVPPIELDVTETGPEVWQEIEIPETLLLPTQHYMIVYEHIGAEPRLAVEAVQAGDVHRSLVFFPDKPSDPPAGFDGNYRLQLVGDHFCEWTDDERWFSHSPQPFDDAGGGAVFADLDDDGHDDLVLNVDGAPQVFGGDGAGAFAKWSFDPFPDTPHANFLLFADLDADDDLDVFASQYVQTDGDGDAHGVDVDCDDNDVAIHPGAAEQVNGRDDDCDGTADDGTDASDGDGDGVTIAAGDCHDGEPLAKPGAPEVKNGRDDDCDGQSDETFVPKILINDGSGHFAHVSNPDVESIGPSSAAAFGDADADGMLDLYAGYWLKHYPDFPAIPSRYYRGQAGATFVDAAAAAGIDVPIWRPVYGVLWTDWNDDAALDVYVSNYQLSNNLLWKNLGDGAFDEVAATVNAHHDDVETSLAQYPGGHSFGSDAGDIDNDGDMDIYVPNISHPRVQPWSDPSMMLVNQGAPDFVFENRRRELGFSYDEGDVNCAFADFDNDGDLDLLVISTYESHFPRLYRNDGADGFVDVTYETHLDIHQAQGGVWSDVDGDGDLDLVMTTPGPGPVVRLMTNHAARGNHWVAFDLRGGPSNRSAIGARVTLKAGGVTQTREIQANARHQSTRWVHFGLGSATTIDEVVVRWPSGATETIAGAAADARFRIVEGTGSVE